MATAQQSPSPSTESNEVSKYKFQKHNQLLVNNLDADTILDYLFQEGVISMDDYTKLRRKKSDTRQQSRKLLMLLHTPDNPKAFIHLYDAMKKDKASNMEWLVKEIDNFTDPSLVTLQMQQMYINDPADTVLDHEDSQAANSKSMGRQQKSTDCRNCPVCSVGRSTSADWRFRDVDDQRRQLLACSCSSDTAEQFREYIVGQEVEKLAVSSLVVGITLLNDSVYLLRIRDEDQVEVYDVITLKLQRYLTVPNDAWKFVDMTSCQHFLCLYIADPNEECIYRLHIQGAATNTTQWPVHDEPASLSVTPAHNVLVTCHTVCKIKEFTTHGELARELELPDDIPRPLHTIELLNGELLVCNGATFCVDMHRVVIMTADGQQLLRSHGGDPDSGTDQWHYRLAVDNNQFVFVLDSENHRITLLSPTLNYIRVIASRDQSKWLPYCMCLDVVRRRLYVAENEEKDRVTVGRVVVFSV